MPNYKATAANATMSVERQNTKYSEQSPWPCSHDPIKVEVSKDITYEVRRCGPSESLSTVSFLFAKAAYEPESFTQSHYMVLEELLNRLTKLKDYDWQRKNGDRVYSLSQNYKLVQNISNGNVNLSEALKLSLNWKKVLPSAHSYFGRRKAFRLKRYLRRHNRRLASNPQPQRFVGVGYRDHGTRRNPATDASPSWQHVAINLSNQSGSLPQTVERVSEIKYLYRFSLYQRKLVSVHTNLPR